MAQGPNLDTTWRGLREIVSPIEGLTWSQNERLSALGLTGKIEGLFSVTVGIGRGEVPVAAKYTVDQVSSEMTLAQCYELLGLELFANIVDDNIMAIKWSKALGIVEEELESFDSAQLDPERYSVEDELAKVTEEIERLSPASLKSASSAAAASKAKRKAASVAFKMVSELDEDLHKVLVDAGLSKIAVGCARAGILSVFSLRDHTLEELEESLKRSVALGAKWVLAAREKRVLATLGVVPGFEKPPAAADDDHFDDTESVVGDIDFTKAFPSPGAESKAKARPVALLSGCEFANILLGGVVLDYDSRTTVAGPFVHNLLNMLATAAESKAVAPSEEDCEGSIDSLDLLLGKLVEKGILEVGEIRPPSAGTRPAAKHARFLAGKVAEAMLEVSSPGRSLKAYRRRMHCWRR